MVTIRDFLEENEDLEILWIAGVEEDGECGWRVRPVTRGIVTGKIRLWKMPIGLWPFLAPGRCFSGGSPARRAVRGEFGRVTISDIAAGQEITSDRIPSGLYSFDGRARGVQRLLRYRVGSLEYLVPTAELIRFLFLHNKTMANTLMHPGGIMELFSPEAPDLYSDLHLRFTSRMPQCCLSSAFAAEFAWLAVHPEGRRSWDSVYDLSIGQPYVSLRPPKVHDSEWRYRGLRNSNRILVLEIVHMSGRQLPCERLSYSHPSFRARPPRPDGKPTGTLDGQPRSSLEEENLVSDFVVETASPGSRSGVRQAALHIPGKSGGFDRDIPILKVLVTAHRNGTVRSTSGRPRPVPPDRSTMTVSVAEPAPTASLPPVEFRLLEPAEPEYVGELQPLIMVIKAIAAMLPHVAVAMSLCRLKPGRSFSMAGRHRRVCLVATFTPAGRPPVVLLDVDHSGERTLSTIVLLYHAPCTFRDTEGHIATLLDGLVDKGGHWDMSVAEKLAETCKCRKIPRVLRQKHRSDDETYLTGWAMKLAVRLDLRRRRVTG